MKAVILKISETCLSISANLKIHNKEMFGFQVTMFVYLSN